MKFNARVGRDAPEGAMTPCPTSDILDVVKILVELRNGRGSGRRHRPPGQPPRALRAANWPRNQYRSASPASRRPSRNVSLAVHGQTNPLSEITHKRRVSALGRNLTRERAASRCATFIRRTGGICPIETPEGPEHRPDQPRSRPSRARQQAQLHQTPTAVRDGKVTDQVDYLSAIEEGAKYVAQANARSTRGKLIDEDS